MVRLHIDTEVEMYPVTAISEAVGVESYVEVPDDMWEAYQQANDALLEAEAAIVEWRRTHTVVTPDWPEEG